MEKIGRITVGNVGVICVGDSALYIAFQVTEEDISYRKAHYDILSGLHGLTKEMTTNWDPRHIKGHQDADKTKVFDRWASLDVEYNYRVKIFG